MTRRRTLLGTALAALAAGRAAAQDGVTRVQLGFAAGGSTDLMARLLAERVRAEGGPASIIVNRPGATGRFAVDALRAGPADGTNLMVAPSGTPVISPVIFPGTNQESGTDYLPVARLVIGEYAVAVPANHPARTLGDLVAWLRANPGSAHFGTASLGNVPHFVGLALGQAIGVEMTPVGYRGGAPMVTDLVGGQIPLAITPDAEFADMARAGRIRILATAGDGPSRLVPEAPTLLSAGIPIQATGWIGLFAPMGTPSATLARVAGAWTGALRHPETRDRILGLGLTPAGEGPEDFARIIAADAARWRPVVAASGYRPG